MQPDNARINACIRYLLLCCDVCVYMATQLRESYSITDTFPHISSPSPKDTSPHATVYAPKLTAVAPSIRANIAVLSAAGTAQHANSTGAGMKIRTSRRNSGCALFALAKANSW